MSQDSLKLPFTVGEARYVADGGMHEVTVPCPLCFGKTMLTVIDGAGEELPVPCNACEHGFDGPRGSIREWVSEPRVNVVLVMEAVSFNSEGWRVRCSDGNVYDLSRLHKTWDSAYEAALAHKAAIDDRNFGARQQRRRNAEKVSWSIRYHRDKIKRAEKEIAYHQSKLGVTNARG